MCIMSMSGWGAAEQSAHDEHERTNHLFANNGQNRKRSPSAVRELRRGVSTLMYACQQGDVETVRRVLHVQPYIAHQRDRTGKSAVHYCCTSDSKHAAEAADFLLMAAPELIDGRDEDGFTPLHLAVIAGNISLVTFLLASKADVNAVDSEKHTVIHWATVCGETEALRACLAAGAPVSTPDVHGGYPLHYAAQMCGGEKDHHLGYQVLQTLLSHPDISISVEDGDGRQPLLWAASAGSTRALLALIKAGAAVESSDKDGLTALHCAASRGHTDCLDTLLTLCGASVDVIDSNGCTALHYAVTLGHADATALLLSHGANANRQDRKGRSPAHCGCAKGQLETVKMLGAHGSNLWLRNARGDLPLHEAAGSGRRDLVKWLLEARPSQVNARNNDGRCPLHLAALNDNADMCKILLDHGAQVNPVLRTSKNIFMTPLDCALQRGFRSTAKYLQLQSGLPANRLGSTTQAPLNTAHNVQMKDDVTLWGEATTSGSEQEGQEGEEKQKKRSYKRKLAYRHEKKITGSDAASAKSNKRKARSRDKKQPGKKDAGKESEEKTKSGGKESPQEKITYNSEVNIIDNSENINIKENGSITINKETPRSERAEEKRIVEETIQREIVRPKSARPPRKEKQSTKQELSRKKTKTDTPDPRRKDTLMPQSQPPHNTPQKAQDINDNIREIESLAHSIEEKAKNICKEVNTIDNINANPDLQSLTSFEETEHQNLIVEASVHAPPKQESAKLQEDLYKEMISSLKEELESIKSEIKGLKSNEQIEEKIKEAVVAENSTTGKPIGNIEIEALKELKDLLEGRMQEIKNTVEEFKVDIKNVIKTNEAIEEITVQNAEDVNKEAFRVAANTAANVENTVNEDELIAAVIIESDKQNNLDIQNNQMEIIDVPIIGQESKTVEEAELKEEIAGVEPSENKEEEKPVEEEVLESSKITLSGELVGGEENEVAPTEKLGEADDNDVNKGSTDVKTDVKDISDGSPEEKDSSESKSEAKVVDVGAELDEDSHAKEVNKAEDAQDQTTQESQNGQEENAPDNMDETTANITESKGGDDVSEDITESKPQIKAGDDDVSADITESKSKIQAGDDVSEDITESKSKIQAGDDDVSEGTTESKSAHDVTADITEPFDKADDTISENATTQIDEQDSKQADEQGSKQEDEQGSKQEEQQKIRFLKSEKKEHHLNLMNGKSPTPPGSSIDTKSSDDEAQATDTSDSSALSVATKREHKSFTVLDTDTVPVESRVNRKKERKTLRKSRSKSEETRLNKENLEKNHERLRRSKIPTVLSKSEKDLEKAGRRSKSNLESRIPILPNLGNNKTKSETNLTGIRDYSDNEQSDEEEEDSVKKRRTKRKLKARSAKSAGGGGSDYESSNLIDSGFEPSPRSSRIPKWKNVSDRGVNMTSVTQSIQGNIRKYHLERKIFQHLLDLKRMQIRAGQHNESMLVKRAIDSYHRSCASTVGAGRYLPKDFTFRSFEYFLYESLRKIQKNAAPDYLKNLPESATDNPLLCTQNTNRCMHATHAYTGIPCAAYLPKMDHHTIPKIGFGTSCKPQGFLPDINGSGKKAVTLELCHGNDKQVISLPTDRLDQNKRYYVTFTVKGQPSESSEEKETNNNGDNSHRHSKSV